LSDVLQQEVGNLGADLSVVQISDSHSGFNKAANPDDPQRRKAITNVNVCPLLRRSFSTLATSRNY
jgi:hypothetical protein